MIKLFRFGIAGCGSISEAHIDSIKAIDGAELTAVWSRTQETAAAVAEKEGCVASPTLTDLAQRDDVDAIIVCTPSGYHLEPALAAIDGGKHVLVEKPLEVTTARCRRIIDAAEERGVTLGVIFQSRFAPANRAVHAAARDENFGRLVMGNAYVKWFRDQQYYDQGAWRGTWKLDGGGALMNQAIHAVDLLLWFMGPVDTVAAHAATLAHERIEVEDTLTATLRFRSGALGTIEAATSIWPGYAKCIEIHGDQGGVTLADDAVRSWYEHGEDQLSDHHMQQFGPRDASGAARDPMAISFDYHRAQIEDFIDAVQKGRKPAVDGWDGLKSVELIEAVYASARTGEVVSIDR